METTLTVPADGHRYPYRNAPNSTKQMHAFVNPYEPREALENDTAICRDSRKRGPATYLAAGGIIAALSVLPFFLAVALDGNNIIRLNNSLLFVFLSACCAFVLLGIPFGGIAYRIRSHKWPIDASVRTRQLWLALSTIVLPLVTALLCPVILHPIRLNHDQAVLLTLFAFLVSGSLTAGIFASGTRRFQPEDG